MRPLTVRHTDIKNSSGKSVVSAYNYTMRQGKYRNHRKDVLISGYGHLPAWCRGNPRFFWQCVEDFSTRKNGVLKRGAIISLPVELTQNLAATKKLVEYIITKIFLGGEKCPYYFAVHYHGKNLHLHFGFHESIEDGITRTPDVYFKRASKAHPEKGGARRVRFYHDNKNYLKKIRPDIAKAENFVLEQMGCQADIEYRSFRDMGITREAQIHEGVVARKELKRVIDELKKNDSALVVDATLLTRLADEGQIDERIAENARRRERNEKRERLARSLEKNNAEKEKLRKEVSAAKIQLLSKAHTRAMNREIEKQLGEKLKAIYDDAEAKIRAQISKIHEECEILEQGDKTLPMSEIDSTLPRKWLFLPPEREQRINARKAAEHDLDMQLYRLREDRKNQKISVNESLSPDELQELLALSTKDERRAAEILDRDAERKEIIRDNKMYSGWGWKDSIKPVPVAASRSEVEALFARLGLPEMAAEIDVTDCDLTDDIDSGLSAAEQRHRVDTAKAEREEELVQIRQPRSRQHTRRRGVIDW